MQASHMIRSLAVTFLLLAGFESASGQAADISNSASACPKGTSYVNSRGDGDGCAGAPKGTPDNITLFQHPDFFTGYANQSGQTYKTRPPWNVAGVDYPVGIPAAKLDTMKDPATATLPAGCVYRATGSQTGTPAVLCHQAINPDFENFDFSGTYAGVAHGCVVITDDNTGGAGTWTMKYNYFAPTSQCNGAANFGGVVAIGNVGNYACDFEYNTFNGIKAQLTEANSNLRVFFPCKRNTTAKYNAFVTIPGRPIQGTTTGSQLFAYNYTENFTFDEANQGHSEIISNTGTGTMAQDYYFYNTVLQGSALPQGDITTIFWLWNGIGRITYTDAEVLNNTTVVNHGQGTGYNGSSLTSIISGQTATIVGDNYSDKIGTIYYSQVGGAQCATPISWFGNYELRTGGSPLSKAVGLHDDGGNTGC